MHSYVRPAASPNKAQVAILHPLPVLMLEKRRRSDEYCFPPTGLGLWKSSGTYSHPYNLSPLASRTPSV